MVESADWEPGDPVPPGYRPGTRIRKKLVIAGASVLGGGWLLGGVLPGSLIITGCELFDCGYVETAGSLLFIPAFGPFISAVVFYQNDDLNALGASLLIVDGLVQNAGLAMLIAGLAAQEDVLVRDRFAGVEVELSPTVVPLGKAGLGIGLAGRF